jgi:VanZ family protein
VRLPRPVSLWLPVLLWAGLIFGLSAIPSLSSGLFFDYVLRKAAHFTEYALLAGLLWRATRDELLALFGTALYSATDEFHQTFVHGRHGTPKDMVFDVAGASVGLFALRYELGRQSA